MLVLLDLKKNKVFSEKEKASFRSHISIKLYKFYMLKKNEKTNNNSIKIYRQLQR
jgi:hypothetical protein